jgi:hypothetical protein
MVLVIIFHCFLNWNVYEILMKPIGRTTIKPLTKISVFPLTFPVISIVLHLFSFKYKSILDFHDIYLKIFYYHHNHRQWIEYICNDSLPIVWIFFYSFNNFFFFLLFSIYRNSSRINGHTQIHYFVFGIKTLRRIKSIFYFYSQLWCRKSWWSISLSNAGKKYFPLSQ